MKNSFPWSSKKVLLFTYLALGVFVIGFYFSGLNYVRNLHISFGKHNEVRSPTFADEKLTCPDSQKLVDIWKRRDDELYKNTWDATHTITRPYQQSENNVKKFTAIKDSALSAYKPILTGKELGFEYDMYAGITAGDINQDGYLDLVLSKINQKIRVLINDQKGNFIDVTACMFPNEIPSNAEYVDLADLNNDGLLDLLVINSQFKDPKANALYYFNSDTHQFEDGKLSFGTGKKSIGGISLVDINNDKHLDFYISFGLDAHSLPGVDDKPSKRYSDEFWVSQKGTWTEQIAKYFPSFLANDAFVGMTTLFTDIDRDGTMDFMLGNDFIDPSMTFLGEEKNQFQLMNKNIIENNTGDSMGYMTIDFNNDGVYELWESGIANQPTVKRSSIILNQNSHTSLNDDEFNKEIVPMLKEMDLGQFNCENYKNYYVYELCSEKRYGKKALEADDKSICNNIENIALQFTCKRLIELHSNPDMADTSMLFKTNPELFPKQIGENTLLRYDFSQKKYIDLKVNDDVEYTGWSWAAFPFDINNDGLIDLYVANGFDAAQHNMNVLLVNESQKGKIWMTNKAEEYNVNLEDDTRGALVADFNNDGDGDIIANNFYTEPKYLQNNLGGNSIEIELRSKNSNYYAVGAELELHTAKTGTQLREIRQGGIWDTAQPFRQHFGIPEGDTIEYLKIRWPDGHEQKMETLEKNKLYVVYE